MARIRSIKPEFWTDGKIRRLNADSALFFIALWNFSDDYGFFQLDTLDLSLKCPRYRPQAIQRMLRCLLDAGLIRVSHSLAIGQIVNWQHQKIKDRRASDWMNTEISWDTAFPDAPESDKKRPRIGKDRIGGDRNSVGEGGPPVPAEPGARELIATYCQEWEARYRTKPPRPSGKDQGNFKTLLKDHGFKEAQRLIYAYFQMPDQWFITKTHDVATLLGNIPKVTLFANSGKMISKTETRQLDEQVAVKNLKDQIRLEGI